MGIKAVGRVSIEYPRIIPEIKYQYLFDFLSSI